MCIWSLTLSTFGVDEVMGLNLSALWAGALRHSRSQLWAKVQLGTQAVNIPRQVHLWDLRCELSAQVHLPKFTLSTFGAGALRREDAGDGGGGGGPLFEPRHDAKTGYAPHSCHANWKHIPPWRQPRVKYMVSLINSRSNTTSRRWHLWEIDSRFSWHKPVTVKAWS
jgi:hypothetical protein